MFALVLMFAVQLHHAPVTAMSAAPAPAVHRVVHKFVHVRRLPPRPTAPHGWWTTTD